MELIIKNVQGQDTGRVISLPEAVFGITPNDHAIYLDVKRYRASQRQGNHKSKQRNEIRATTKKLKKQKGTGGARAGSMKSPLFVGGGRVFGPQPRDYSFKLNKKLKQLARRSALSYKALESSILILDQVHFDTPSTKGYRSMLAALELEGKKTLLVLPTNDPNTYLSARNLPRVKVLTADQISTYDVMYADIIVLAEESVSKIESVLSNN